MAFTNQTAVVTGASSGIGWALALELAASGCRVGLIARRQDQLDELAGRIRRQGGTARAAAADVGDWDQVQGAVDALRASLGPIDLLVANAGVGKPTLLPPINLADIEEMFRVNVLGVVYAISAVLPEMLGRRRGHLAAVSSLAAYKGLPGESAYCASKAAVNTYLEGLRIQLRGQGIRVTTICPGFVTTPMTADNDFCMPGLMDAATAARRIVRALARRIKVYDFPWQTRLLMKATRWLPDWLLAWGMRRYNERAQAAQQPAGPSPADCARTGAAPLRSSGG